MDSYLVAISAHKMTTVVVEAESADEALDKAFEQEGMNVNEATAVAQKINPGEKHLLREM